MESFARGYLLSYIQTILHSSWPENSYSEDATLPRVIEGMVVAPPLPGGPGCGITELLFPSTGHGWTYTTGETSLLLLSPIKLALKTASFFLPSLRPGRPFENSPKQFKVPLCLLKQSSGNIKSYQLERFWL